MKTSEELTKEYEGPTSKILFYTIGGVFGFLLLIIILTGGMLSLGIVIFLLFLSAILGFGISILIDQSRYKKYRIEYDKALKRERKKETKKQKATRLAKEKKEKENRERRNKAREKSSKIMFDGLINAKLVCPHCQSKGTVRTKRKHVTEETRQKGIIGATIGMKTVTDKGMITHLSCDNCDIKWTS